MVVVLTNDDGIDAPGIRALLQAVRQLDQTAVIVAPQQHLSGCSHQVTTTAPIVVQQRSEVEYAIVGTPADCTRIALTHLCPDAKWVLSGINAGGNLGADVYISGTVAAVREAALLRVPGIAISHYRHGKRPIDWDLAANYTATVLASLMARTVPPATYWNVNLPHLEAGTPMPEMVFCSPCSQPLPVDYQIEGNLYSYVGEYGKRSRDPGSDVETCFSGHIAVTQLHV